MSELEEGLLLVDKPKGISSFDVIRRLRRELGVKKMGHAGTLDPLASGLMIIGVGAGTKKLSEYIKLPKTYRVDVLIGKRTSTGDLEGEILEEKEVISLEKKKVNEVAQSFVGVNKLPVPAHSAVKRDGQRLYKAARSGKQVETPVREMLVSRAEVSNVTCGDGTCTVSMEMDVSSGTYIRSLAEELGKRLSYPATVQELRRTRIGDFDIKDARKI